MADSSGNDNWVGNSKIFGKETKRTPKTCPLLRGSGPDRKVVPADCTSANPFICEFSLAPKAPAYPPPGYGAPPGYPPQAAYPGYPPQAGAYPPPAGAYPQPAQPYPAQPYPPGPAGPMAPGPMAPPDYGSPIGASSGSMESSYDIPDTNPETTTPIVEISDGESSGGSKKVVLPVLIICKFHFSRFKKILQPGYSV